MKDQSAYLTTRAAVGVAIYICIFIYLCMYFYIWLLKNKRQKKNFQLFSHSLLHIDTQALTSHVDKMPHRKPLGWVFMLVTLTLSEPHEIPRIKNWVEEKMGIEKIGESDINFWLHSLHPLWLFVTFVMNSFPLPKRRTFWMV